MKNPEKNNIHDTFDGSIRFTAPVYQRYYVWKQEELQALLDDIENAADNESIQFIGATVVQDFGKKGGTSSPNEYLIIDGQQRLTTIYLLIAGLANCYLGSNREEDAMVLIETYLSYGTSKYKGVPKLLPTIQDRKQLFDLLEEHLPSIEWTYGDDIGDETSKKDGIKNQWKNIINHFQDTFFNDEGNLLESKIEQFQENLLNNIELIQITLEPKDDANTAFSKLNYEGVTLSLSDLVRNDVFSRLENRKESLESFYKQNWKPFEKSFPNKSFEQYIAIYSTIKFKGKFAKSRAFPELQKSWSKTAPEDIIIEMKSYSDIYCSLVNYVDVKGFHKDVNKCIRRFSFMPKTTVTWPYILELLHAFRQQSISKKNVVDCMAIVESFLVRRAIAGLEPTGLHAVFKSLWGKAGPDPKKLKEKIVTATIRCPNNEQLREDLKVESMYSRQITKYLLIQREIKYNEKHGYDNALNDFSIEHVLPKNLTGEWATLFTKEEHRLCLNTIGNLIPLTKGQNSKIKDDDWDKKKLSLKGSNWKLTQKLSSKSVWNRSTIDQLTDDFIDWACTEWPDITP